MKKKKEQQNVVREGGGGDSEEGEKEVMTNRETGRHSNSNGYSGTTKTPLSVLTTIYTSFVLT